MIAGSSFARQPRRARAVRKAARAVEPYLGFDLEVGGLLHALFRPGVSDRHAQRVDAGLEGEPDLAAGLRALPVAAYGARRERLPRALVDRRFALHDLDPHRRAFGARERLRVVNDEAVEGDLAALECRAPKNQTRLRRL